MNDTKQSIYCFDEVEDMFDDISQIRSQIKNLKEKYVHFSKRLACVLDPICIDYVEKNDFDASVDSLYKECEKMLNVKIEFDKAKKFLFRNHFKTTLQHIHYDLSFIIASFLQDADLQHLKDVSKHWRKVACHSQSFVFQTPLAVPKHLSDSISLDKYIYAMLMIYAPYLRHFDISLCGPKWEKMSHHRMNHLTKRLIECKTFTIHTDTVNQVKKGNQLLDAISRNNPYIQSIQLCTEEPNTNSETKFFIGHHASLRKLQSDSCSWKKWPLSLEIQDSTVSGVLQELPSWCFLRIALTNNFSFKQLTRLDVVHLDIDVSNECHCLFPVLQHLGFHNPRSDYYYMLGTLCLFGFHDSFNNIHLFEKHFPQLANITINLMELNQWNDSLTLVKHNDICKNTVIQGQLDFIKNTLPLVLQGCQKTLEHFEIKNMIAPSFWCDEENSSQFNSWAANWKEQRGLLCDFACCFVLLPSVLKSVKVVYSFPPTFYWNIDCSNHALDIHFEKSVIPVHPNEIFQNNTVGFHSTFSPLSTVVLHNIYVSHGMDRVTSFIDRQRYQVDDYHPLFYDLCQMDTCVFSHFHQLRRLDLLFHSNVSNRFLEIEGQFLHFQDMPFLEQVDLTLSSDNSSARPLLSLYSLPHLQVVQTDGFDVFWVDGVVSPNLRTLIMNRGSCWNKQEDHSEFVKKTLDLVNLSFLEHVTIDTCRVHGNNPKRHHYFNVINCEKLCSFHLDDSPFGMLDNSQLNYDFHISLNPSLTIVEILGLKISSWIMCHNTALQLFYVFNIVFHQCDIQSMLIPWLSETVSGNDFLHRILMLDYRQLNIILPHLQTLSKCSLLSNEDDILRDCKFQIDPKDSCRIQQIDDQGYIVNSDHYVHWTLLPLLNKMQGFTHKTTRRPPLCLLQNQNLKTSIFDMY